MKSLSILCLLVLITSVGCSDKKAADTGTSAASATPAVAAVEALADAIPTGKQWQVTVDGGGTHGSKTLMRQHVSGKMTVMGTAGPGGAGIILMIPMATPNETGTFTKGVEITLPGVPSMGSCEHRVENSDSSVSANITQNTKDVFAVTFTFKQLTCGKSAAKVSGSGTATLKK